MANTYPPASFFFRVEFTSNLSTEISFQSVTGLSVDMQTEPLKEGGENRFEHILPVRTKYNPLILKRGLLRGSKVIKWCMDAILNFDIHPVELNVNLLSVSSSTPLITWKVINAWPKKWSVSEFNAEQNSLAIESIELNYSYFEIMEPSSGSSTAQ
ncbi:MAG: phage tail protein [Leptolyngbyaceae cyanobacterium MO_188.B28]|nr:phage tail protein [Leptolyngbyaceae cyanobacterium MO_188.B28]